MKEEQSEILKEYEQLSGEEYLRRTKDILDSIKNEQVLRFFYIFISEKMKGVH